MLTNIDVENIDVLTIDVFASLQQTVFFLWSEKDVNVLTIIG